MKKTEKNWEKSPMVKKPGKINYAIIIPITILLLNAFILLRVKLSMKGALRK